MRATKPQPYRDGMVRIYEVSNSAGAGNLPVEALSIREALPFDLQTVGMARYYQGLSAGMKIDQKIRTPRRMSVTTQDVAVTHDGVRYRIRQVQYPTDVTPDSMDLSLERVSKK